MGFRAATAVSLALAYWNTLFTIPHILCTLATAGILPDEYVTVALTDSSETKHWDQQDIDQLRQRYLSDCRA